MKESFLNTRSYKLEIFQHAFMMMILEKGINFKIGQYLYKKSEFKVFYPQLYS